MRVILAATLFLLALSAPALAEEKRSYAPGYFAGDLNGEEQGLVQPVEQPAGPSATGGGGLGTRALNTAATPAPVQLPANALRPKPQLPAAAQANSPAANGTNGENNSEAVEDIRRRLHDRTKEAESEDRMGNFEIQDIMNTKNQSKTLGSQTQKKLDDTDSDTIRKVD